MTVNAIQHTRAETELLARFESSRGRLGGSQAVAALREAAASNVRDRGLPHRRVEEYKYSDLRTFLKSAAPLAAPASKADAEAVLGGADAFPGLDRYRIVIANGELMPDLSDLDRLASAGVTVEDFAAALNRDDGARLLDTPKSAGQDGVLALNTAFVQGGVVLTVADGAAVDWPVEIIQVAASAGAQVTRSRVLVGKGACLQLLETFAGETGGGEINAAYDYVLADEAKLSVTRLITSKSDAAHLLTSSAILGANAELKTLGFIAGPAFARNQQFVEFRGENSEAKVYGLAMATGTALADQTLVVDHLVPHCNSREFFKTVLDGSARGVYQGRINVAQHAQKTDGEMMTQALLLSEDAEMANKPELEIFADDVVCAHGATCGEIDADLLFYLRARGIPEDEAKTLLVLAFLSEAIEEFDEDDVAEHLRSRVRNWLASH